MKKALIIYCCNKCYNKYFNYNTGEKEAKLWCSQINKEIGIRESYISIPKECTLMDVDIFIK
jgi:hypothetical protein